ncbi:ornithine cyclodeaminase family protein [Neorhizobium sp. P12A]|uniref:ornithine cyclodeaminase family protein n=1 Tax=Neorhizobium sp. P12A TaxID=2268027 RepID=UPI0011ECF2B7|nr:ornithine cyclodeaminase family protein [Neorhizobium sp. P12A]KAA0686886.1 ornithine cyclodeaminase family protein [Neorhizobium sp. P12A]
MIVIGAEDVTNRLGREKCIALMREAMIGLSAGTSRQPLRNVIDLGNGELFGVMPGVVEGAGFGAKLVSVFPSAAIHGRSHQGAILLFDRGSGAPVCVVDAGAVTAIRTACASAAATDTLAHADAKRLAILGTGEQAWQHALAIPYVRQIEHIAIWGRSAEKARHLCERLQQELAISVEVAASLTAAAQTADIICTTTSARDPILFSADVRDGTHVNVVGSSYAGPAEIDEALVKRARFFPDHREAVLAQGAEFLRAKAAGFVSEEDVLAEIGTVFAGAAEGRVGNADVTVYKSLGSIVQDLACAAFLHRTYAHAVRDF